MTLQELRGRLRAEMRQLRHPRRTVDGPTHERPAPRPSAFASYGDGSWLVPPCQVDGASRITVGSGTVVLEHADVTVAPTAALRIGARVRIGRFLAVACSTSIDIGDDVGGSDCVGIVDELGPVTIEAGAYLGANSVVIGPARVGRGAYVGEGAVVTGDVAAHTVVYGNPAQVVRTA